jgi:hypothetical protein
MKRTVHFFLFLPFLLFQAYAMGSHGSGGIADPGREMEFVRYLVARGDLDEAVFMLNRMQGTTRDDSIHYFMGWILYQQKELLPSATHLLKVSDASPLYLKSRFFGAYNLAHMGMLPEAVSVLEAIDPEPGSLLAGMKGFQLAGMALLQNDFGRFSLHSETFDEAPHLFAGEAVRMMEHRDALRQFPARSPLIAGALSAAVPGLGKIYAGKTAEGIVGFLYVAAMGATAWDFYRGAGPQSALFILSASVTGIFYLGNIWGSAVAVKRQQNEFRHEMDQRILFDMHIPLRNAFN